MPHRFHCFRGHAGQRQRAAHLFTQGGEDFHLAAGVLMGRTVLYIDDAYNPVAGDDGRRKKRLESIFRKFSEVFESRIFIRLARYRQQAAFQAERPAAD